MIKFVKELSPEEELTLKELSKFGPSYRYRQRAHMVLLSARHYTLNELSDIFQVNRNQVSEALNRWSTSGLVGLKDLPGKGRQRKLDESALSKLLVWVETEAPRSAKEIMHYVEQVLALKISEDTIKNYLKQAGFSYKRLCKAVKDEVLPESIKQPMADIGILPTGQAQGQLDLEDQDGKDFSLTAAIPFAWQKEE